MVSKGWIVFAAVVAIVLAEIIIFFLFFSGPSMEEMVTPTLASFYDIFDQNHDNRIDLVEAERFYRWCRVNIRYRYDDEQEPNPAPGIRVGDGRPGREYWQKPIETYNERMGDCEDMAIFSVAFYRYNNISAYIVLVNAKSDYADHAICAVNIGTDVQEIREYLGEIVYYKRGDGCYLVVDMTYSNRFGQIGLSSDEMARLIRENRFVAHEWITLEEAYKLSG